MSDYIPKKRGLLILDWYVPINILLLILVMCVFFTRYTFG
ncbi:signal peptidase I, partial [Salmonella enterica subsp. enterica serovar 1,4,[5],12:i:-]|nr:signal peptidase I [Salmonella enterica subsp. enterica serovar 1,4,[5],12:i:-]